MSRLRGSCRQQWPGPSFSSSSLPLACRPSQVKPRSQRQGQHRAARHARLVATSQPDRPTSESVARLSCQPLPRPCPFPPDTLDSHDRSCCNEIDGETKAWHASTHSHTQPRARLFLVLSLGTNCSMEFFSHGPAATTVTLIVRPQYSKFSRREHRL